MFRNAVFFASRRYTFPLTYGHGQLPISVMAVVVVVSAQFTYILLVGVGGVRLVVLVVGFRWPVGDWLPSRCLPGVQLPGMMTSSVSLVSFGVRCASGRYPDIDPVRSGCAPGLWFCPWCGATRSPGVGCILDIIEVVWDQVLPDVMSLCIVVVLSAGSVRASFLPSGGSPDPVGLALHPSNEYIYIQKLRPRGKPFDFWLHKQ